MGTLKKRRFYTATALMTFKLVTKVPQCKQRYPVNVKLNVVNMCAKLTPINSRNSEIKGINVLQKFTLIALSQ